MPHQKLVNRLVGLVAATAPGVGACGSGAGDYDNGMIRLAVGDAPVDGAQSVVVKFTGIELTAKSGNPGNSYIMLSDGTTHGSQVSTGYTTSGVYWYSGTVTVPEDLNSMAPSADTNQPLASKLPVANSQPPYYYQFAFLPPGTYALAFTCEAALDNPDQADGTVKFNPVKTAISVVASQTTTVDIP